MPQVSKNHEKILSPVSPSQDSRYSLGSSVCFPQGGERELANDLLGLTHGLLFFRSAIVRWFSQWTKPPFILDFQACQGGLPGGSEGSIFGFSRIPLLELWLAAQKSSPWNWPHCGVYHIFRQTQISYIYIYFIIQYTRICSTFLSPQFIHWWNWDPFAMNLIIPYTPGEIARRLAAPPPTSDASFGPSDQRPATLLAVAES